MTIGAHGKARPAKASDEQWLRQQLEMMRSLPGSDAWRQQAILQLLDNPSPRVMYIPPLAERYIPPLGERRTHARVPVAAQFLLRAFLDPDRQEDRLGDLEELFRTSWVPHHGPRGARILYWLHAIRIAGRGWNSKVIARIIGRRGSV